MAWEENSRICLHMQLIAFLSRIGVKDDLWKVTIHEFLHSRGLPHCKKNAPKCLMQDAHGKNTFYMKHGLCEDCKNSLRMIMTHQER